jgi:hypothetical protein
MEEQEVRAKVREVLRTGAPCSVCDVPVTSLQLEFEIQFARGADHPGLDKYHVHVRCFAAWEFERRRDD